MAIANTTSRWVWAYETTPRTSAIDDATDTTYDFGEYRKPIQKWQVPSIENKALAHYTYDKITPHLTDGMRMFNTFHTIFNPTTPQWLLWALGKCTDGTPDTIEPLDTGYQYPLTIRHEEGGGTNPTFQQAVSSWCVSAFFSGFAKEALTVDLEWAFEQFEDHDDEPQLTTPPRRAGHTGVADCYNGMPTVTYDPDGSPAVIDTIVRAEGKITNNFTATLNGSETQQKVYKRTYEPVDLTLQGVMKTNTYWDDFMDRGQQDWEVKFSKPDSTYYTKLKFVNAIQVKVIKEGEPFKGWFLSTLHLKAEEVTVQFAWDGSDTWANHFKGEVV